MIQTNVVLETGEDRRNMVLRAVEALGDEFCQRCKDASRILIKVNLVHHENQLASTHIDAVRGLLDRIRYCSQTPVVIGDASYYGTKAAFRHFGYERLPDEYDNIILVDLNDDDHVDGYTLRKDGSKNRIRRSKIAAESDFRISLTPMKMHRDTGVSLTVKNWTVGTWIVPSRISSTGRVWARWPWLHEEGPRAHHASIAELYKQLKCDVGIIDGVVAMEGDGPSRGDAVQMGVVIAGFDPVAVDAVGATMMSVDPGDIGYLAMCHEQGLGTIDMTRIDVPPMIVSEKTRKFARPLGFEEKLTAWREEGQAKDRTPAQLHNSIT